MVNDYAEIRLVDNDGEVLIDLPAYDKIPNLIIAQNKDLQKPSYDKWVFIIFKNNQYD